MFPLFNTTFLTNTAKNAARINLQFVRFNLKTKRKEPVRKPIWETIAPSKLYRIRKKETYSLDDQIQRDHLSDTYTVNIKSIRNFLREQFYLPTIGGMNRDEEVAKEEQEQLELINQNDLENKRLAKMRKERLEMFTVEREAQLLAQKFKIDEENKRLGQEFDDLVRQELKRSKTYITKENLDFKVEEALANPACYDYAIDKKGKIVYSGSLHPYALAPKAIPETSSNVEEYQQLDDKKSLYIRAKKIF